MDRLDKMFGDYMARHQAVFDATRAQNLPQAKEWVKRAAETVKAGRKLMFFGNGGSAADAQHLAAELSVRFLADRKALPAIALTTDSSVLTACGNDYGFDHVFARQIEALAQKGDMAIGISTSGKSKNVLKALDAARNLGVFTLGLTGESGGDMAKCCDLLIKIPSSITAHIQEMHIMLGQAFCAGLEIELNLESAKELPWAA